MPKKQVRSETVCGPIPAGSEFSVSWDLKDSEGYVSTHNLTFPLTQGHIAGLLVEALVKAYGEKNARGSLVEWSTGRMYITVSPVTPRRMKKIGSEEMLKRAEQ